MADVQTKHLPSSFGAVTLVVSFMTGQMMLEHHLHSAEAYNRSRPFIDYELAPSTHGEHGDIFARERNITLSSAAEEIQSFYQDLLSKQENLGSELEKVVFENLWELYAR
jgi:hypothetical protein